MDAILAFHSIDGSGSVLSYRRDELAALLAGLREEGVALVPLGELLEPAREGRPRVALTFDDGLRSVREAAPLLLAAKAPATIFVVAERVGLDNGWPSQPREIARFELLSWAELAELRDAGLEIGGHTATHPDLRGLAEDALARELNDSKRRIEDELGVAVRHFAYPYGGHDEQVVARVRASYATAVTTRLAFLPEPPAARDPHLLPRLDAWYLREPARALPLFGRRSRARLAVRALLRRAKRSVYGG